MALVTTSEEVFACWRRSCAPPPVGKGGSNKGGRRGGDAARRAGIAIAKKVGVYSSTKKFYDKSEEEQDKMIHDAVLRAGRRARAKHNIRTTGKAKGTKSSNEFIDKNTAYDKYRDLQKSNKERKAGSSSALANARKSNIRPAGVKASPTTSSWNKSSAANAVKKGYGNGVEAHVHKDTKFGGYEARVTKNTSTKDTVGSSTLGRERFNSEKAAKAWAEKKAKEAASKG